jgi:ankyrin repeat protein
MLPPERPSSASWRTLLRVNAALTKPLFDAIAASDLEGVKRALDAGASADAHHSYRVYERFEEPREQEESALVLALRCTTDEIAIELVVRGANVDEGGGAFPVVVAVEQGHLGALAAMLARSPLPSSLAAGLLTAASYGRSELGMRILEAGAEPSTRALCRACSGGADALVLRLLDAGIDVNATDSGTSPLASAAWRGNVALVAALIERGADLGRHGGDALLMAANAGRYEVVAALLARGVPADAPRPDGWTALMTAAWQDHAPVARLLLEAGASPDHQDLGGKSVLDWARESRGRLVVALLEDWSR